MDRKRVISISYLFYCVMGVLILCAGVASIAKESNFDSAVANIGWIISMVILCAMGVGFVLFGVVGFNKVSKQDELSESLKANGRLVRAVVERIDYNNAYSINRRHPYIIICSYIDPVTNKKHTFNSYDLWENPFRVYSVGDYIDVYVDGDNYRKYVVDVQI